MTTLEKWLAMQFLPPLLLPKYHLKYIYISVTNFIYGNAHLFYSKLNSNKKTESTLNEGTS